LEVLGKCSQRYGLMQNSALIDTAEAAFAKASLGTFNRRITVTGKGARVYAVYDFKDRTKKLKVGDDVGLRLTVQNSFDGLLTAAFDLGMLRLICLNGATTLVGEVSMSNKHYVSINIEAMVKSLEKAIDGWDDSIGVFDTLAEVKLTQAQGSNILGNLTRQGLLSEKLSEGIGLIWQTPRHKEDANRTLYNLYNAATEHLTHEVSGTRFELANRTNRNLLKALNRAAHDSTRLGVLTADLPVEAPQQLALVA
jgi:hypothetical protein